MEAARNDVVLSSEGANEVGLPANERTQMARKGETISWWRTRSMKLIKRIGTAINDLVRLPIVYMPGALGRKVRYWYYRGKFKRCGKNVIIDEGVVMGDPKWISIGDNVWIDRYTILVTGKVDMEGMTVKRIKNPNFKGREGELIIGNNVHIASFCVIQAHGGLRIGNNCGVGVHTAIYTLSNHYKHPKYPQNKKIYFTAMAEKENQYLVSGPIVIEDNVGIARGCLLYCGVTIGKNSFIMGYSEVVSSILSNTVFHGKTGKSMKRFEEGDK